MGGARIVRKAMTDTFDHLIYFILMTFTWWLCVILIVPGPAATLALFVHADPRHGTVTDRPTWTETIALIGRELWRAWRLALITGAVMALLLYNIVFYGDSGSVLGALAPFWLVLFFFAFAITCIAFALTALEQLGPIAAIKTAAAMTGLRLPQVIVLLILIILMLVIGTLIVVPLAMFLPMTIAAAFDRFVLQVRRIDIPDPFEPTAERLAEPQVPGKRRWRF